MGLFSSSSSGYLGVDFDMHSIKVVELVNDKGRPKLKTYGYFDHPLDRRASDKEEEIRRETAALIRAICKKAKTTTQVAVSALPAFSVFSSIITLPAMSKKELASAVKWEAKKVIPLSLEEMILHYEILEDNQKGVKHEGVISEIGDEQDAERPGSGKEGEEKQDIFDRPRRFGGGFLRISRKRDNKNYKVLLTAAPRELVNRYIEIFKESGLTLISLDTEPFALIRSLVGYDPSTIMIVDLDFTVTSIVVIQDRIPYLNRSINVGGLNITRAIANSLNISLSRAEQLKYDVGIASEDGASGDIPKTMRDAISPIVDEIRYSINLFKSQGREKIEKIILTGGSSMLKNLPEYLSHQLDMNVILGDPWERVIHPKELESALQEIGPRFSVALGLAMKEIR